MKSSFYIRRGRIGVMNKMVKNEIDKLNVLPKRNYKMQEIDNEEGELYLNIIEFCFYFTRLE